jgi:hypothetical protein
MNGPAENIRSRVCSSSFTVKPTSVFTTAGSSTKIIISLAVPLSELQELQTCAASTLGLGLAGLPDSFQTCFLKLGIDLLFYLITNWY